MKKQIINDFFLGILIAFTISILILSLVMMATTISPVVPVTLVFQSLILSILCSMINLIYRIESFTFIKRSIIAYILTTTTIIACSLIFKWYGSGNNVSNKTSFILILFFICSLFYLITWIIIWKINMNRKEELNKRLNQYKRKQ